MDVCGYQTESLIYIKHIRTQLMLKNEIYTRILKKNSGYLIQKKKLLNQWKVHFIQ